MAIGDTKPMPPPIIDYLDLDRVFHALADPTRRALLAALAGGVRSASELAAPHELTLQAVLRHLAVLVDAQLIGTWKNGRTRYYRLAPHHLEVAERWIAATRDAWEQR